MLTVRDVYDFLDGIAPFAAQMSFDNSGLMVGDMRDAVRRIGVCLDITPQMVEQAAEEQVDLLVAHHPVLFKPRRQLLTSDPAYMLIRQGMAAICTHTCWDIAAGGVNDVLAKLFSLSRVEAVTLPSLGTAMVRVGFLPESVPAAELAAEAADVLRAAVRWCDGGKTVETLAVCGGSGGDLVHDVAELGVDALLTGDADYHDFLDAEQAGLTLIAAGHFETETPAMAVLADRLRDAFPSVPVMLLPQKRTIQHI